MLFTFDVPGGFLVSLDIIHSLYLYRVKKQTKRMVTIQKSKYILLQIFHAVKIINFQEQFSFLIS